ncbi:MAG: protein-L-isoaspartate(D-aspartate) O-methyltransferase [bacterium]|nr:protein-L-isoaspartate(D-aspartate) O-methyltransferase [bacterium]
MRRLAVALIVALPALGQADYRAQREAMVRTQIEARGISNQAVLRAMRETPRHEFVPKRLLDHAYADHPLPIGYEQTISQPYIVAYMTEKLDVEASHRVLEIGTGSGYQAAVLSGLVKEVFTMEIVPELAASVKKKLARYRNVTVLHGDGYKGWPSKAPFDRIILTAAPPVLPEALIDQLKSGGKLLAPVGRTVWSQELVLVEKTADGKVRRRPILAVRFVPMVRGK